MADPVSMQNLVIVEGPKGGRVLGDDPKVEVSPEKAEEIKALVAGVKRGPTERFPS